MPQKTNFKVKENEQQRIEGLITKKFGDLKDMAK